ncbi:MAG: carboxypeptidase regulatory-like domain-containing protein [Acidobacteriota bacterium]
MNLPLGRRCLSFFSLCLFAALAINAQDLDDVEISGRIVDSNNQAVVGATIKATETQTGVERTVTSNEEGRYSIIELKPGVYKVIVNATGFGAKGSAELQTVSGQNVRLDFDLSPAGVTAEQNVTVTDDDAPIVDTSRTIVGGTITEREIEEIPNSGRNPLDLVLTLGGTSEEQLSTSGLAEDRSASVAPLEQGNFSLSGGTAYSNNLTIDGLDNNDDRSSRDRFQPSLEGIAEVQVITNQFSSEYGRASGGRINLRTRSGSNRFRGRAFMFYRDDALNANTYYNNAHDPFIPRPKLTEYNPGFTFSGPVILPFGEGRSLFDGHNRTFFAMAYEYAKVQDTTLIDAYVPVVANPRYTLPTSTGGSQTCDGNPPVPNPPTQPTTPCAPTSGPPTAAYVVPYNRSLPTPNNNHTFTARIDHKLFKNNDITFGLQLGFRDNLRQSTDSVTRLEDAFQAKKSNTRAYNVTDNHVFGANAVNQIRAQYSIFKPSFQTSNPNDPVVLISYRDPVSNSVRTLTAGNSSASTFSASGSTINFPDARQETRWQFQDSLTLVAGSHTIKTGIDYQSVNSETVGLGDATGTFNFNSVLNYGLNTISRYRQNFGTASDVKNTYYGVFINDEFKPASNLTVSYGMRYERETAVDDNNNFGPRLGIAWDPFKKGKGVIRFGAGIFYNRVLLRTVGDSIQNANANLVQFDTNNVGPAATDPRRDPILRAIAARFPSGYASTTELRNLVTAACATVVTTLPCNANTGFSIGNVSSAGNPLRSVDADLKIPESYQFNVGFEREIGRGLVFEANYTVNKTAFLWRDVNSNAPVVPAGYATFTEYLLANPFILSPTRRYTFYLGSTTDASGIATAQNGTTNCTTTTTNCFVNLNTTNGSSTIPLVSQAGLNNNATGAPIGIALAAVARFRPDQTVQETSRIGSHGNSFYQGLILEMRSRIRKIGFGFAGSLRANYTLSSTMDDGLNNTSNAEINGDFSREWARTTQDRRHRFNISGTFDTPVWLGKLRLSPLFRYGSSSRFNLGAGDDRNLDDGSTDRVNFSGSISGIRYRGPRSPIPAALIAQLSLQPIGSRGGNLPRNAGTGPSFFTLDLNVTREWKFRERMRFRPVIEFDNILNASVFSFGSEFVDFTGLTAANSQAQQEFLVPTRTYRQRQIRIGFRFDF